MNEFILLTKELQNILESLTDSLNEENLSEKIMTKKQAARKRKLRAKKRAEKRAAKKQAELNKEDGNAIEAEIVDDEIENDNSSNGDSDDNGNGDTQDDNKETHTFKYLVKYEDGNVTNTPKQHSETYIIIAQKLTEFVKKYDEIFKKGWGMWKSKGNNQPCPQDARDFLVDAIDKALDEFQKLSEEITNQILANKLYEEEVEFIENILAGTDKYLNDLKKYIDSIEPETLEIPDDLKDDVEKEKEKAKEKNKGKDLLTFSKMEKALMPTYTVWNAVKNAVNNIMENDMIRFGTLGISIFTAPIMSIITSPVAKDIVSMFMNSNPITAIIYSGALGNFGIKNALDKIKTWQKANKDKKEKEEKNKTIETDELGLPTEDKINTLKVSELRDLITHTKHFINFINIAYNHPDTDNADAQEIEKLVTKIKQALFTSEGKPTNDANVNRAEIIKNLKDLIKVLKEVATYQKWKNIQDVERAFKKENNDANKEKRADAIQTKQNKDKTEKIKSLKKRIKDNIKVDLKSKDAPSDDEILKNIFDKFNSKDEIDNLIGNNKAYDFVNDILAKTKEELNNSKSESYIGERLKQAINEALR